MCLSYHSRLTNAMNRIGDSMAFVFCEAIVCLMLFIEWHYRLGQVTYNIVCTARRSYASAVLGVVILSVRLSVCPSVTRLLCD